MRSRDLLAIKIVIKARAALIRSSFLMYFAVLELVVNCGTIIWAQKAAKRASLFKMYELKNRNLTLLSDKEETWRGTEGKSSQRSFYSTTCYSEALRFDTYSPVPSVLGQWTSWQTP